MKTSYLTDSGRVRSHNEDSVTILKNTSGEYLLIVADGMGGHRKGEVASSIVVTSLGKRFNNLASVGTKLDAINWLNDTINDINLEILSYGEMHEFDNETLYKMVKELDENTDIHVNNRKRLIRRLNQKCVSCEGNKLLYDALFIGLTTSREKLYERINKRVDEMVADGLINEVKSLYDKNIRSKAIMTGIGYKELYEYFDSKLSLEEAIDLIKKRSRHYAKRQYTWFNNQMNIKWFDVDFNNFDNTFKSVVKYIEENK